MADDPGTEKPAEFVDKTLIKPIELDDAQGRWVLAPKADITALETMLISQLFAAIVVRYLKGDQSRFDWRDYLMRPHATPGEDGEIVLPCLKRHFKVLEGE